MSPYVPGSTSGHALTRPTEADLAALAGIEDLTLFEYQLPSFAPVAALTRLRVLKVQEHVNVRELGPLTELGSLHTLVLATPPTWDGRGRYLHVESFAPLARMTSLRKLVLLGVRPDDLDLSPIATLVGLEELKLGVPDATLEQLARLSAALPNTQGACLSPYVQITGIGFCKKCKGKQVLLTGAKKGARQWLCPTCNAKKLAEHVSRWEAAKVGG